jgi:hypothetical protein
MLTLLSDTEVHQLHSHITELTQVLDNLTRTLGGAQTVQFEVPTPVRQQPVQVSDTPRTKSQRKTRVSQPHRSGRGNAVLTASKVAEIKHWLAEGKSTAALARQFHVHWSTVNCIKHGKTWKNIQASATAPAKPLEILEIRK